jgi:hypothetical protein
MQQITGEQARTRCYGRLLELKKWGGGWIEPLQQIDHPSSAWNRGHIYLTRSDVRPGFDLQPGDVVAFYLYADKKGLGAEDCFPVRMPPPTAFQAAVSLAPTFTPPKPQAPVVQPPPGLAAPAKPEAATKSAKTTGSELKAQAPPYKPSLCAALGFTDDDEPSPSVKSWSTGTESQGLKMTAPPVGPPPGFAPLRDNFSVNFALLQDSDDEDEYESNEMDSSSNDGTAKSQQLGDADEKTADAQSVCGSFSLKSSAETASTCAGLSDRGGSHPTTPATPAKCVLTFAKGLEKITSATVFSDSDSDDDDEPACEPTPGASQAPSPEVKEISVPDPMPAQNKILPAGYKIYMI